MATIQKAPYGNHVLSVTAECALKLVKDAVILVEIAELVAQMIVNVDRLDWSALHVDIPDLERQVIARENIASILAEFHIRDRRNDF